MDDAEELILIERDIEIARKRLQVLRQQITRELARFGVNDAQVDELLTVCDEFGPDYVRPDLRTPTGFIPPVPTDTRQAVCDLLDQLMDASYHFDTMVDGREAIRTRFDPTHKRVYPWFGREFVMSDDQQTLTFLDDPAAPEPARMEPVANRTPPKTVADPMPAPPTTGPAPARRRTRDRDR